MKGDRSRTILIIEEHRAVREFFTQELTAKGLGVISATDGRSGVCLAERHLPDVITCAVALPEMDGYTVLSKLRQNPATSIIPLIFVTTKRTRPDLRKAMELGANDYLTKPCTAEELLKAITAQLEKQSLLQQWYEANVQSQSSTTAKFANSSLTLAQEKTAQAAVTQPLCSRPSRPTDFLRLIDLSEPPLDRVFRFIEDNYHQPIALSDVAKAIGYSPAYLTNLSSRQTGQTIQRWIITRRMAAACSLLLETDQSVEQVALQVGYHHAVHFFRQFRQFYGTTPCVWRETHQALVAIRSEPKKRLG